MKTIEIITGYGAGGVPYVHAKAVDYAAEIAEVYKSNGWRRREVHHRIAASMAAIDAIRCPPMRIWAWDRVSDAHVSASSPAEWHRGIVRAIRQVDRWQAAGLPDTWQPTDPRDIATSAGRDLVAEKSPATECGGGIAHCGGQHP